MSRRRQRATFADVAIGEHFYTGVGFNIKRSATTADYFGISTKSNRDGETWQPDATVFIERYIDPDATQRESSQTAQPRR